SAVVVFVSLLGYFGIKHMGIFTYRQVIVKEVVKASGGKITNGNNSINSDGQMEEARDESDAEDKPAPGNEAATSDNQSTYIQGPVKVKYEKSGLQKEAAERIHRELDRLMLSEKIFKKEELSLAQLAEMLDVHPNNLSQVINTYENKNFYDYINTLRVEEFKTLVLLPENDRFTILSLAFECGFNSKTAFNRNFKKITGLSPSEYLKEMNVHLVSEY
ncbi:MAG TPA: helix-turn-helix domain-containing protein, partial [Chitinophagaceae bacterium]